LLCCSAILAQPGPVSTKSTIPVGTPYTLDIGQATGLSAALSSIPTGNLGNGISLTWSFVVGSGSLPPGLTLSASGVVSGTPTTPGTYSFVVNFTFSLMAPIQLPAGIPTSFNIPIYTSTLTVTGGPTGPQTSVQPGLLSFSFATGAAASMQTISVINRGNQAASFSASASTRTGGNWLTASTGGSAPAFGAGPVQVTANPAGLTPGTYAGYVAVTVGTATTNVSVVITVSGTQQLLTLSQTGLTFRTFADGGAPPPQTFTVLNGGSGSLNWTLKTSTLSGGSSWLSASPASGTSGGSGSPPTVQVTANPAGLAAGDYYGQVQISAAGVSNSPQTVSVVLSIAAATTTEDPVVLPTGLIFVGVAGGSNPAAKSFTITNITSKAATYVTNPDKPFYSAAPATGTVTPNQPVSVSVQPSIAGLAAGVYLGDLVVFFKEANTTHHIAILLVVVPAGTVLSPHLETVAPRQATGCTATKLLPVFTQLGQSFTTTAAWPTSIEVTVVDDCGNPMTSGSVVTTFSSGDPLLPLNGLGDGRWAGTWQARNATTAPVSITATAQTAAPPLQGTALIGGNSTANNSVPVISVDGPESAASYVTGIPVSPGSFVAIKGSNLGQGLSVANQLPLGTQLNGTQVLIAGELMPLYFTSDGQINGVVPFDVAPNATHQVIVQRGNAYSVPASVTISAASPAVFTSDSTGSGLGIYEAYKADGTSFLVDENHATSAGDVIVIYCTGLGPVTPAVPSGSAAPDSPLSPTTNPVSVTIGGQTAAVSFAGLAPEFVGVYQINATIPAGVTPGDAPLLITVAGQTSPPVTIPVQ